MTSNDIRTEFLKYFEGQGHRVVPSHSLLPPADPSLLFVNAGMVQFKDVFTGRRESVWRRATTTQKCLRVSGKHNDLEQVGRTPRHHTFFEMLGNFSFGDYFKADAVRFAWDLLVNVYGLKADDLWITVHPDDNQARELWISEVGVDPSRLVDDPTNFWSMGDTGPCGHCSEIHIDRGPTYTGSSMHDQGNRFMELWNLVFMQYDRDADGKLTPLPAPSIDTGMGLERICSVLQGVRTNYETDLFLPLMDLTAGIAGVKYGRDEHVDTALRVVADHARATAFLIADGIYPDNEGRGYVLRRLMRRALRFGNKLGLKGPFFTDVVLHVQEVMGAAWPELQANRDVIQRVAGQEEDRFLRTLSSGLELLDAAIATAKVAGQPRLDGNVAFNLYDTHGFPVDLTDVIAAEQGLAVDQEGFTACMQQQRERGRASWKAGVEDLAVIVAACREAGLASSFNGYDYDEAIDAGRRSQVLGLFLVDGTPVVSAAAGTDIVILVRETPFYGESGGQAGDKGVLEGPGGRMLVKDVRRPSDEFILHVGTVESGAIANGEVVNLMPDVARRWTRRNHSATHLLHNALRAVLGNHVRQRGSLVTPDRLRFDFSHTGSMTDDELREVEARVQAVVLEDLPVTTDVVPIDQAIARGALHFFGDKYGDVVRMVSMGQSKELCGGTHAGRTGEIGPVVILAETGISAGVRRLEAITGPGAMVWLKERARLAIEAAALLKTEATGLVEKVSRLLADEKVLKKELADLKVKSAAGGIGADGAGDVRVVNGVNVLVASADGIDAKGARDLADVLRGRIGAGIVLLTRADGDKLAVILAVTQDLADRFPAGRLLGQIVGALGGRGGGNPSLAQGSIPDVAGAGLVLDGLLAALSS